MDECNSANKAFFNSLIKEITFLTKAGSALVPISNKAETIGLKMVNLAGKCYSKASSTFFIPPWIWIMLI